MTITVHKRARKLASLAAVLSLSAGGALASTSAASAAETPLPSCNYDIGTKVTVCVPQGADLDAAVYRTQGLRVASPTAKARPAAADAPDTVVVISQLYDDANYGGSFLQITWTHACDGSTVFYYDGIAANGWTGRVSSFKSFSSCTTKVWQGRYTGASYGYYVNAPSLGAMNDQATTATIK